MDVTIDNQFGEQIYPISQRREFCVPTRLAPPHGSPAAAFLSSSGDLLD